MAQEIFVGARLRKIGLGGFALAPELAPCRPGNGELLALRPRYAESVERVAMRRRIEQAGLRELAFDFDRHLAKLAQQADARGLVVDESAAAAVGADHAAQHDDIVLGGDAGFIEEPPRRMIGGEVEFRRDHRLRRAGADKARLGAHAERQAEGIEKDRFAGTGLAGQHTEAWAKGKIEPVDQNHVADGEAQQHRGQ